MKKTVFSTFLFLTLSGMALVSANAENLYTTTNPNQGVSNSEYTAGQSQAGSNLMSMQKNGKALGILSVVNNNEINAARVVLQKTTNPDVKKFAQVMIADHTKNVQDIQMLSKALRVKPVTSQVAAELQQRGQMDLRKLQSLSEPQLDKVYMDAMVAGHTEVLAMIQNELLPMTTNPQVKNFLNKTADKVNQHLQMAKKIQDSLS